MNLAVQIAPKNPVGLRLSNPVMTASGTFGYGIEYQDFFNIQQLGAIICKGTTLEPREGNPQPRLVETTAGLLNSIGFQNVGVDALIKEKAPIWSTWQVPVIVNIAGNTVDEYAQLAHKLNGIPGIRAIEVNISCPNIKAGGIAFGTDPIQAGEVTAAVKQATSLPILVKLTPNTGDIVKIADAVAAAGADAVTVGNTLKGMAIDVIHAKPILGNVVGGLSGPAIKPNALYMVFAIAGVIDIPIIGCGGITTAVDAIEFILAGATAVEVGTANFKNPRATLDILEGIMEFMKEKGHTDIKDLIGIAQPNQITRR